ncbi:MAG TPA: HlyC/CorC family transporter [Candidatus Onthenecus intestinigallinarum]|uniref:HlyC/CorC family transporter n=1 Tax=Candidatus Onthenecus intestinigallinarum TaxID=2840875 RepID=A0A9D0ZBE2_9FIRM|nr:HlyC/CorC family transporter [Candidatus Onthenecus intestinigallinarum]
MDSLTSQILLQVVFILLNAFFAGSEIAFLSLNTVKLNKLAEEGDKSAPALLKLVENPNRFLSGIQVAITLSGFLSAAFGAENFSGYLVSFFTDVLKVPLPVQALSVISMVIVTVIISFFSIAFGEMVPKRIAMQKPLVIAKMALSVMRVIGTIFAPIIALLNVTTNGTLRLLGMKTEADDDTASEEDIRLMVENSGAQGAIAQDEQEWIENVFDFGDLVASEAMTPEPDVTAFRMDESEENILETIRRTGLSRYPVYEKDINHVRGILNARDFLINLQQKNKKPMSALLRPAYFVPESVHADQLFKDMQSRKQHLAIVVDEYGGTAGIVTIEDLLEEIVGNIYDEFDPEEPKEINEIREGVWRVSGSLHVEELADALDITLPEDLDYDTVAGMILSCLPTVPEDGSTVTVEIFGLRVQVESVRNRKICWALVEKIPQEEKPEEEEKRSAE